MGLLGVTAFWSLYADGGYRMSINVLNFAFLFAALLLHAEPGELHRGGDARRHPPPRNRDPVSSFTPGCTGLMRYSGLAEISGRWFV